LYTSWARIRELSRLLIPNSLKIISMRSPNIMVICISLTLLCSVFSCQKEPVDYSKDINDLKALVTELQHRSDSLATALGNTNTNLSNLSKSVDSIKLKLTDIQTQIDTLTLSLNTANANIAAINAQLILLNQQYASLLEQLNAILALLNAAPPTLSDGLVAYYPFSGNAGDSSGNGNHGNVNGATLTTDRFGTSNNAYSFNGSESITGDCSNFPSFNSARTISFWYNSTELGVHLGTQLLGYGGYNCGESFIMNFENYDAGFGKYEIQGHCLAFRQFTDYPLPANNYWHNITLTYDTNNFRFYNDGTLVFTSPTVSLNTYVTGKIFAFGKEVFTDGSTPYVDVQWPGFKGSLDDIRIYNRALSQSEITYLASH